MHRVTMGGKPKLICWSAAKDAWLRANRGVGFEAIAQIIADDAYLVIIDHWNRVRYPNQRVFVLEMGGYAFYVPFVEADREIFLKTIFPSRQAKKRYLGGD